MTPKEHRSVSAFDREIGELEAAITSLCDLIGTQKRDGVPGGYSLRRDAQHGG